MRDRSSQFPNAKNVQILFRGRCILWPCPLLVASTHLLPEFGGDLIAEREKPTVN